MAKRGPKPKSTADHKRRGTYRADRHAARADTTQTPGAPIMRDDLGKEGRLLWKQIVEAHRGREILAEVDSAQLNACCQLYELYLKAAALANKHPTDKDARIAATNYYAAFSRAAAHFGLTPADRASMKVPEKKKQGVAARQRK